MEVLLRHGADPLAVDPQGRRPQDLATAAGRPGVAARLEQAAAKAGEGPTGDPGKEERKAVS